MERSGEQYLRVHEAALPPEEEEPEHEDFAIDRWMDVLAKVCPDGLLGSGTEQICCLGCKTG